MRIRKGIDEKGKEEEEGKIKDKEEFALSRLKSLSQVYTSAATTLEGTSIGGHLSLAQNFERTVA